MTVSRLDLETGECKRVRARMPVDPAGILDTGPALSSADGTAYGYGYRRLLSTLLLVEAGSGAALHRQ